MNDKKELLKSDFMVYFNDCEIGLNSITVSNGRDEQVFFIDSIIMSDINRYYTPESGAKLADLIWLNFQHIINED